MNDRKIAENIRWIRECENLTQDIVAKELGLSQSAYSRRESGRQSFSASEVGAIARLAKADIRTIFR